jgi:hypothetical protein
MTGDELWNAIARCSGEQFATKTGIRFAFTVDGDSLHLHNTNQVLGRRQFEDAAGRKGSPSPRILVISEGLPIPGPSCKTRG